MARLLTVGYEVEVPVNAVLGPENPNALATTGTLTRDTANQRGGVGCLGCNGSTGLAASAGLLTPAASKTYFIRAYIRVGTLPTATTIILGPSGAQGVSARLTSAGKLQLWNNVAGTQIGSDSAASIVTGAYYRVELQIVTNGSTQVTTGELRLEGATVATFSALTLASAAILVGWVASPGSGSKMLYVDGVAVNDSTGTVNNTWPGPGRVIMLLPVSDNAVGAGWTRGNGTAISANGWDSVNNAPPTGIADLGGAGADTGELRNAGSNANANYDANLTTYTAAGIKATDAINAVMPWVCTSAPVATTPKLGTIGIVSNPTIAQVNLGAGGTAQAFWSGVAGGTYPTGWKWSPGTITEAPSVTLGTAPVARIQQVTASTRIADVCFLGLYVDFTAGPLPMSDTGLSVSDTLLSTWTENFESGTIASLFPAGSGGTVALDNTVAFTGAQSLHVNSDPAYVRKNFVVNNGIIVMRFYVRFGGIPSSGIEFMNFIGGGGRIGIDAVTKQIGFNFGTSQTYGALSGIVPNVGQWYRIDCRCDASNNPWVFDWQIDGVAQTQVTFASAANLTVDTYIGHSTGFSVTLNAYFDTIKVSQIAADYPIGPLATIYNRTASDTGLTVSESLARTLATSRALTDTGSTVTETLRPCQLVWPVSDASVGGWIAAPLWSKVDEPYIPVDADEITSSSAPSDTAELALRAARPSVALTGGYKVRYRIRKIGAAAVNMQVSLVQGTTVIATWTHTGVPSSYTTYEQVLTDPQAASITDYTNLRVRLVANT